MNDELAKLESRIVELEKLIFKYLVLAPQYVEPARRYEGMLIYSDATVWDPGSGAGLYQYRSNVWTLLA